MSENKVPSVLTVNSCRETYRAALERSGSHEYAMRFSTAEAFFAGGGTPSSSPEELFAICNTAFAEKLSRTNDMDAAFVKMVWVAYQAGCPKKSEICETCNGNGWIGGPSYYSPDEGGEACPDCSEKP